MLGWEATEFGEVEVQVVPGNHLTRLTVHGKTIAQRLRACLDMAQPDGFEAEPDPAEELSGESPRLSRRERCGTVIET
jgi:hypothetical protein